MQKFKLKLLFFITFCVVSMNILCMEHQHRTYQYNATPEPGPWATDTSDSEAERVEECPICYTDNPEYTKLACGHRICNECAKSILATAFRENDLAKLRCPETACLSIFKKHDYAKMKSFAFRVVANIQEKLEEQARPVSNIEHDPAVQAWIDENTKPCPSCNAPIEKNFGCDHMKCKKCKHEFCWLCLSPRLGYGGHTCIRNFPPLLLQQAKQERARQVRRARKEERIRAIGIRTALAALAGYGLYKFTMSKKQVNSKPLDKEKAPSLFAKTVSKIQAIRASSRLMPVITGAGLYFILTKTNVNLSRALGNQARSIVGYLRYYELRDSVYGNILASTVGNKHVVNAGISTVGGLIAGYAYKLLRSASYKPRPTFKPRVQLNNRK